MEAVARGPPRHSPMHHRSSRSTRTGRGDRRRGKAQLVRAGRAPGAGRPGARRRRRASGDLLAHVCEIVALFPDEGAQALAELVGRLGGHGRAGAAVAKGCRAGFRPQPGR